MPIRMTLLDRAIAVVSPQRAFQRIAHREALRGYLKSGDTGRKTKSWRKNNARADEVFSTDGRLTRERAIYLTENNAQVGGAVTALKDHIVGRGITTNCEIRYNPSADDDNAQAIKDREAANQKVEDAKSRWLERAWHVGGSRMDPVEAQTLRLGNIIAAGEDIVHKRYLRDTTRSIPLAYEAIDPSQLTGATGTTAAGTRNIIEDGIEYDTDYNIVAYHIQRNSYALRTDRVPAADIIHSFRTDRPGQRRGISWLAPIIPKVYELEDIIEYALVARRVQSAIAVLVHKNQNGIGMGAAMPMTAPPAGESSTDTDGNRLSHLQPGMIHDVGTGNVTPFTPSQATDLDDLVATIIRAIAVGIGVSYEWCSGDYRKANFASARLGENRTWKRVYSILVFFVRRTESPMHRDFIDMGRAWNLFPAIPQRADAYAASFSQPHRDWGVNPLQEVTATITAMNGGLTSLQDECGKRGKDWRNHLKKITESNEFAKLLDPKLALYNNAQTGLFQDAVAASNDLGGDL